MAAYIEINVKGGRRAYVEVGSIAGIISSPGMKADSVGTDENPLMLVLRGGVTFEVVGTEAIRLLVRTDDAKKVYREGRADTHVDWLNPLDPADRDGTV